MVSRLLKSISITLSLLGLFILFSAFASFLAGGIIKLLSGASFNNLTSVEYWETIPAGRWYMLSMQAISALGSFFGTFWAYRLLFETKENVISTRNENVLAFILIIFLTIGLMPFSGFVAQWNQSLNFGVWAVEMELKLELLTKYLINFSSFSQFLFGILVIGVIPAIGEELLFRGILQRRLGENFNYHIAIWLSATLFSAIHLQFLGFFPRMILGALFGYLYYFSGDLKTAIFAHFVNNSFTLLLVYLYQTKNIKIDIADKPEISVLLAAISFSISMVIFVVMYQFFWKKKIEN